MRQVTRKTSLAIGTAVLLAVVTATVAMALNAGFVAESEASTADVEVPVTTTTTYDQYLEEYYANNPTTTLAPTTTTSTTAAEPVVVYEYVDVPVTVPAPRIIYVPVPTDPAAPAAPSSDPSSAPPTEAPLGTTQPTTTQPPATTQPPTTQPPAMDLLEFDLYGFADITVASHGPGDSLQFWEINQDSPWVWEIEDDNGEKVKVEFFNTSTGDEAKLQLEIRDDGYRLKTEGSGFPDREENL
jgi:hypothetical protein